MDIAGGAIYSDARNAYAYFSKPYRTETDVLILRKGANARYPFQTVEGMLDTFAKQKFRLGVIAGYIYADQRISAFIADPANQDQIFPVAGDSQNLRNLLAGVIDGFLADRIAATTTAWRRNEGSRIEDHPVRFTADIHFMLSRATQTPQMLARLDNAIDEVKRSGEFRRIANFYALPVLIYQTLDSEWFRVLVFLGTATRPHRPTNTARPRGRGNRVSIRSFVAAQFENHREDRFGSWRDELAVSKTGPQHLSERTFRLPG